MATKRPDEKHRNDKDIADIATKIANANAPSSMRKIVWVEFAVSVVRKTMAKLNQLHATVPIQLPNKKPLVHNVLKVIDISAGDVSAALLQFLKSNYRTYSDAHPLTEHLYNVPEAYDNNKDGGKGSARLKAILPELERLAKLCEINDAGYVRFIYS